MNSSRIIDVIHQIRQIQETNKLVIFVGAGVSKNVEGMVDWSELVDIYAKAIHYSKCKNCRSRSKCKNCGKISRDYTPDEYLKIPQYYFNKHPQKYYEILRDAFPNEVVTNAPLSDAILSINPSHIITTNYDKLIESSESAYSRQYETIIHDYDLLKTKKNKYIVKMHGDLDDINTIILKEQDYLEYSETHVLIELFIKSLLVDHTFLFLGYSLNDYNVKLLVSWINYLRAQNPSIKQDMKAGYIVQDEEHISPDTSKYYAKNGLQVLNIRSIPLLQSLPAELTSERGKRLYTFLSVIRNPHQERQVFGFDAIDDVICFLRGKEIYDYTVLMKALNVFHYDKKGEQLEVLSEDQYDWLSEYMMQNTPLAQELRDQFLNVGITSIKGYKQPKPAFFEIGTETYKDLYSDPMFTAYIQDDYLTLSVLCEKESNLVKKAFYRHFISGYTIEPKDNVLPEEFEKLSLPDRISFLHNEAACKTALYWQPFDSDSVTNFINNIPDSRERQLYQGFVDIYSGNDQKKQIMDSSLEKLKKDVQSIATSFYSNGPLSGLYDIRNIALAQYYFCLRANIYMQFFDYAGEFFHAYIEGIIIGNSSSLEKPGNLFGSPVYYDKYFVSREDFDIITKCISPRDLNALLKEYKVKEINTSSDIIDHLIQCFINLANSVLNANAWGSRNCSLRILSNLALILTKVELPAFELDRISRAFNSLFSSDAFNKRFWTIDADSKAVLDVMADFVSLLVPAMNTQCIKSIVAAPDFYDFVYNSNLNSSRRLFEYFIAGNDTDICCEIDAQKNVVRKALLIRLSYKSLRKEAVRKYKAFLSKHIKELDSNSLYTFIFAKWIKPSKVFLEGIFSDILTLSKRESPVSVFPDPMEAKIEMVLILHLMGYVDDLKKLDALCSSNPILDFILHEEIFDYSKVDFSNYMWENVARTEKYMKKLVIHKEQIKTRIISRMSTGDATETEKKILYSHLLSKNEIWEIRDS